VPEDRGRIPVLTWRRQSGDTGQAKPGSQPLRLGNSHLAALEKEIVEATGGALTADELTAVTDPLGNTTIYAYTPSGDGVPVGLQYCSVDPVDYQAGLSCPAYGASHLTGTATETFNAAGYVVSSTDADGHATSYTYSTTNPGLVATITSPDGTVTSYTYNAAGDALLTTVSFGSYSATTQVAYDGAERQFCEVAPNEYAKGIRCPAWPITTPTPGSDLYLGTTITTYNADSQVTQTTNPLGGITYTAYDDAGRAFCSVAPYEAAQGVTCPSAPPSSPPTVGNDPYLGATIATYNAAGQVVQVTNPLGGIMLASYDPAGNVLETTVESNNATADPNLVTSYSYDADNRVVLTTVGYGSASPATTEQYYDPNGNVFCSVSANAYAQGPAAFQCPTWQTGWITTPPSPGALYSTTPSASQANNVTTAFHNADRDEVQTTNPDVETSVSAFDADGRAYCTSDPVNVAAWLRANPSGSYPYVCPSSPPLSPPAQGSNPGYTTTIYDPAGLTLSTTDQLGDTTTYGYDSAGLESSVTDPSGSATDYCYYYQSGSGNCAASAPAGGGAGSDQYSQLLPDGATTTYTYYPGGAADTTSSPAGTTTDSYDALGDLTAEAYSQTASGYSTPANVSYTYYVDGSRESMTDGTGTTTYTPDAMGDVTSQAFSAASGSGLSSNSIGYSYFTTGVLASVTYPSYSTYLNTYNSPTVTYTYDALGNMASETDWLGNKVSFAHDGDGNLTAQDNEVSSSYPNGTSGTTYAYDGADLNTTATSTLAQTCGGQESLTQSFAGSGGSRNADGEVTEDSETYTGSCSHQGSYERNYSYDLAGQVVFQGSVAQGSSANNFAYSPAGDPTEISSDASSGGSFDTYSQTYNTAEELTAQTPIPGSGGASSTYGYDTIGDETSSTSQGATTHYTYDSIGQMTGMTDTTGVASYEYTGDGLEAAASGQAVTPSWGPMWDIDGAISLYSVSCAGSSFCAAVDADGNALIYNGSSWSQPKDIDGKIGLMAVSCPTATTWCMAVDAEGNYLTYTGNGTTNNWSSPHSFDTAGTPLFVSCPTSTWCMAVDESGNALIYSGSPNWTTTSFDGANMVTSVSCRASNFCIAVDYAGNAFTYNGSWTKPKDIDGTHGLDAVSCDSSGFCIAVDNDGNEVVRSGGSWASPHEIDGTSDLLGVSVVSSSFAVVVDIDGNALMYNGSSWSTTDVDGIEELQSTSCTSTTFCAVIDLVGHAGFYSQLGTQQLIWDTSASEPLVLSDETDYYVYGATGEPVEQVNVTAMPPSNNPVFLTYTPSDSSWLATNPSGDELAFWRYDAFGTLALGTPDSPFGYAGQFADTSSRVPSGFGNMRARWYQAQTGEFTSVDPDFGQTDQAYSYADDDPVNGVDPTGLCSLPGKFGYLYPGKCTHNYKKLQEIAAGYAELSKFEKESGGGGINWWALANWAAVGIVVIGTIPFDDTGLGEAADGYMIDQAATDDGATADETSESANADDTTDSDAPCGGQSFRPSTEVVLATGVVEAIADVRPGNKVMVTNPETGKTRAEPVTAVWVNRDADLLVLTVQTVAGDTAIDTTQHHLFYDITTHGWVQAEELHPGDHLYTLGGGLATVIGTQIIPGAADMWDLTVAREHDFYIDTSTTDILVHNCPSTRYTGPASGHGADQLAEAGFDNISVALIKAGSEYPQQGGGVAYVSQTGPDEYNMIVENDSGSIVTAHSGMTLDELNGLAKNYRWTGWP